MVTRKFGALELIENKEEILALDPFKKEIGTLELKQHQKLF
ncbi:hypothetical protein AT48_00162 [Streptococcus equi subsp. zooepidemicus SzAM60]|nr:hypothetical protein [Streptococcus equi]KIS13331.1 hypothetical protein AT48_00162 [Streptococcus equi subsp. zooepidemicus SzAM60]